VTEPLLRNTSGSGRAYRPENRNQALIAATGGLIPMMLITRSGGRLGRGGPGGAGVVLVRSERTQVVQQVLLISGRQRREVVDDCVGL